MNKDRLLKLAEHLESGELRSGEFNLCRFNACALGECPAIWPDEWAFDGSTPGLKLGECAGDDAEYWFDISWEDVTLLFYPAESAEEYERGQLPPKSTRYDVARHIREFVARKEEE